MSLSFILHIFISAMIFAVLASGFKLFVRLRGNMDFSYMAIVIVGAYAGSLANIHRGTSIITSIVISFIIALPVTILMLFLSKKLNNLYFSIGTFTLYVLCFHLALNLDTVTGGALGLSGMSPNVIGNIILEGLSDYFFVFGGVAITITGLLVYLYRTHLFTFLQAWGMKPIKVEVLGSSVTNAKIVLVLLTTLLAVIGGNLYSFYYLFIAPESFWIVMTLMLIIIVVLTQKSNEFLTLGANVIIFFIYEYLRFFKFVDPSKIGYLREMLFGLFVMISVRGVYRKIKEVRNV